MFKFEAKSHGVICYKSGYFHFDSTIKDYKTWNASEKANIIDIIVHGVQYITFYTPFCAWQLLILIQSDI